VWVRAPPPARRLGLSAAPAGREDFLTSETGQRTEPGCHNPVVTRRLPAIGGNWRKAAAVAAAILSASCGHSGGEAPAAPATPASTPGNQPTEGSNDHAQWASVDVAGLPPDSELWDVTEDESGLFVAIGSLSTANQDYVFTIWTSEDGRSWQEVLRRHKPLGEDDAFVGIRSRVVAHDDGFAVMSADCASACTPVAYYSPDGAEWTEVRVPTKAEVPGGATRASTFGGRVVLASPDYTDRGAQILDVTATGRRLVAVGWAENEKQQAAPAAWSSPDGGRTWRRAPEDTFPPVDGLDELSRLRVAGNRLVAGGGNRCCYHQSVQGLWVADLDGDHWRHVTLPEGESVSISDLAVAGDSVHVIGDADPNNQKLVHWRLPADDRWDRFPAPPVHGRLLAAHSGFSLVAAESMEPPGHSRLNLFTSPDGRNFQRARTSDSRPGLTLEAALIAGGRLHAYASAGERNNRRQLLFIA
jgi:hypothetical protein